MHKGRGCFKELEKECLFLSNDKKCSFTYKNYQVNLMKSKRNKYQCDLKSNNSKRLTFVVIL